MVNIRKFLAGIGLVPISSTAIDTQGEMEVISSTGKLNYHNGTSVSPVVTEAHTSTLTNKTISDASNTLTVTSSSISGQVTVAKGGTGQAALTAHDVLIGNGTSAVTLLAPSATSGIPLVSQGSSADPAYTTAVVAGGGTGATTLTSHGVLVGQGTSAIAATAAGTSGQPLLSGGASADPAYGTLSVSFGGTGDTTLTNHGVLIGQGTSAIAATAAGTSGQPLLSGGASADPAYGTLGVGAGGTGQTSYTNGQLLIGNTSGNTLTKATLTAGTGITITNGNGSITVATSSAGSVANSVTQTAHGFAVGDIVYYTGSAYAKAKANAESTSEVLGIVSTVTDANNFAVQMVGYITGLSGLTAGNTYYLSDATAGLLTSTEPTTVGSISKPVLVADSTTSGYVIQSRGVLIAATVASIMTNCANDAITYNNFGTVSGAQVAARRHGDMYEVNGYVTAGTVGGSTISISLPAGHTIDYSKLGAGSQCSVVGELYQLSTSTNTISTSSTIRSVLFADGSDTGKIFLAYRVSSHTFVKENGTSILENSCVVSFRFAVPLVEYAF